MNLHITASFLTRSGPSVRVETYPQGEISIQVNDEPPQEIIIPRDQARDLIEALRVVCRLD